jgi:hypothetical protein
MLLNLILASNSLQGQLKIQNQIKSTNMNIKNNLFFYKTANPIVILQKYKTIAL